ncbi:TonB-dependent receptor [Pedobacter sp. GR22-6]|uniref:TonB-dependent receptor n=1 Tax=Pedobacter sp. GR22-6 TaxID=3127957 RepID=UPI00307E07EB
MFKSVLMLFICCCSVVQAMAQVPGKDLSGQIIGVVRDSSDLHPIQAATISIYKRSDSALVTYLLTNNAGNFRIGKLLVDVPLRLTVSYVGYHPKTVNFIIDGKGAKLFDLKEVKLRQRSITLGEVAITNYKPPVEMNGDTLEFNADAFKLDKNAVVEDLLRKLPGIIIWGDGKITINGRTVKNVLVEGKPFFGGQTKVATHNLPKDAVEKIQVYTDRNTNASPLDSLLNLNIKLKNNKKVGVFGKLGGGYGTRNRRNGEGMLSLFNTRSQLSLAGSSNNTNVLAKDVNAMINNSSFKGVGVNIEFQPDFSIEGQHMSNTVGINYQHDFIDLPTPTNKNRLDGSIFLNDQTRELEKITKTLIAVTESQQLIQDYKNSGSYRQINKNLSSNYNKKNDQYDFYFSPKLNLSRSSTRSTFESKSSENLTSTRSIQTGDLYQDKNDKYFLIKTGFNRGYYKLDYTSSIYNLMENQTNQSKFTDLQFPSGNSYVNRHYKNSNVDYYNEVKASIDPKKLFLNKVNLLGINLEMESLIKFEHKNRDNQVSDADSLTNTVTRNDQLSVINQYKYLEISPKLAFNKLFIKELVNRYRKSLYVYGALVYQSFRQNSTSTINTQIFDKTYGNYLPNGSLYYANDQYGDHHSTARLEYKKFTVFPTLDQRAPLPDDVNRYYQYLGNMGLRPSITEEVILNLDYTSFHLRNFIDTYSLTLKTGFTKDNIADSTNYDNAGRALGYLTNVEGAKYFITNGEVYKAFKYKDNQLQLSGKTSFTIADNPYYSNGALCMTSSIYSNSSLSALYTVRDFLAFSYSGEYSQYLSKLKGPSLDNRYRNNTIKHILSFSINVVKTLTLSSNASLNRTSSTSQPDPKSFTIWNSTLLYRFLKTNQAELKFSALDLLRQNTNIVNYGTNNNITVGQVNVLQNYFLLAIAYYPRKFGSSKANKKANK